MESGCKNLIQRFAGLPYLTIVLIKIGVIKWMA
jgi:hypothetical protein